MEKSKPYAHETLWWACATLGFFICTAHFSVVMLNNMPMTPLRLEYATAIDRYVNPVFRQKWNFFAPTPVERDHILLARGSFLDKPSGVWSDTPWVNISESFISPVRNSRLSPLGLFEIGTSNAVVDYVGAVSRSLDATFEENGVRYIKTPLSPSYAPVDAAFMTRTSSAVLRGMYPNIEITKIQIGILEHEFPRYTQRFQADDHSSGALLVFPWQENPAVAAFCCVAPAAFDPHDSGEIPALPNPGNR